MERLCACYYLKDYERKKRGHISFLILLIITSTGFLLSLEYHRGTPAMRSSPKARTNPVIAVDSTLFLHISMLVINLIASMVNLMIEKYNYRKLRECTNLNKSRRGYSLAERFQISENIRTCLVRFCSLRWYQEIEHSLKTLLFSISLKIESAEIKMPFYRR